MASTAPGAAPGAPGTPGAPGAETAAGTLYLVPTPIGNFRDITLRAIDVLRAAAVVAAEDTRKARTLLRALDIEARLVSYYDFNEEARSGQLLAALRQGRDVAVITDRGPRRNSSPGLVRLRASAAFRSPSSASRSPSMSRSRCGASKKISVAGPSASACTAARRAADLRGRYPT